MLKIQVLGSGSIPRGYGLAPRLEPFYADINLIALILDTRNLKVNFINPETGVASEVTKKNLKTIWDKYSDYVPMTTDSNQSNTSAPVTPAPKVAYDPPQATGKPEPEHKNENPTPVSQPNNQNNNHKNNQGGNNNNQKNNNHNNGNNNNKNEKNESEKPEDAIKPILNDNK